jgi:hypothetical protein
MIGTRYVGYLRPTTAKRWVATGLLLFLVHLILAGAAAAALPPCPQPGWFPSEFGLKDHTVFQYAGGYYLAAIYLGSEGYEDRFAYAASPDLCQWEDLGGILQARPAGGWDEFRIWAPYVYEEGGVYYLFYTGVTEAFAQSIMLATSIDPSDPASWQHQGLVFQPDHPGSVWGGYHTWSDCRDPMVLVSDGQYYLYYTGLDTDGGVIGVATAPGLGGPWTDWGAILTQPGAMLESPTVVAYEGLFYLFYHQTGSGSPDESYRYGPTPAGPWTETRPFWPGWAHEIWRGLEGDWYTSFLTDYSVTIRPLTWDDTYAPPRPYVGAVHRIFLPFVSR